MVVLCIICHLWGAWTTLCNAQRSRCRGLEDNTGFTDLCTAYYYTPCENQALHFVDHSALDVTTTPTTETPPTSHSSRFRRHIVRRDRKCVVTRGNADVCDAAYIIPRKKGDAYIKHIVQSRHNLYPAEIEISSIDDIQNGILLRPDLRRKLGYGAAALLRTPNFALGCDDIPKGVRVYPEMPFRITMQNLEPDDSYCPVPQLILTPSLLRQRSHYQVIPHQELTWHPVPDSPGSEQEETHAWRRELDILDQMNLALMLLKTSPEELAMEFRKGQEEEELRERKASRMKVLDWIENKSHLC